MRVTRQRYEALQPCLMCHFSIGLPNAWAAKLLATQKTWPGKIRRRRGLAVPSRAEANRRTAVRAGNAQPQTWGKRRPDTVEAWQEWAFKSEQYQWVRKQSAACWSKHPDVKRQMALLDYYHNHETRKAEMAARTRRRYHRYKHTPEFRMRHVMRNVIARIARKTKSKKSRKTNEYLGCTFQEARGWIERQFKRGMRWDNHGEWEIHHKIPLAEWDLTDPQQMVRATHFTNLRPLWRHENRSIGARIIGQHQMALL